jgi:hypothetical protein
MLAGRVSSALLGIKCYHFGRNAWVQAQIPTGTYCGKGSATAAANMDGCRREPSVVQVARSRNACLRQCGNTPRDRQGHASEGQLIERGFGRGAVTRAFPGSWFAQCQWVCRHHAVWLLDAASVAPYGVSTQTSFLAVRIRHVVY